MTWIERRSNFQAQPNDAREPGDIDYGRVIHSAAFRRLQGKTQIYNLGDSDFYRTRLTHSIEVAQVAAGLVRQLAFSFPDHAARPHLPDHSLILAISSAHDIGHPPFGHGGEIALNYCMREFGGFEGNGQTLRVLSKLEHSSKSHGADLSRRALLGILKYPAPYSALLSPSFPPALSERDLQFDIPDTDSTPPKCYLDCDQDVVDWIFAPLSNQDRDIFTATDQGSPHLKTRHKSFDCSLMDVADDIAYGVHDFEDALALRLIEQDRFSAKVTRDLADPFLATLRSNSLKESNDHYQAMIDGLFGTADKRKHWINRLVGFFVTAVTFDQHSELQEPLLRWRVALPNEQADLLKALKALVWEEVIQSPRVQQLELKGQSMVISVTQMFMLESTKLLPRGIYDPKDKSQDKERVVCDYVASMTDAHLVRTYERLFSPRMGSVFDEL